MKTSRRIATPFCWVAAILAGGCAKVPPPVTEVAGVVLLNDKPLPQAQVEFIPDLQGFGAELNSTATTDDHGRFTLTCNQKGESGAVVAKHWVIITDPAVPEDLRGMDARSQAKQQEFLRKLVNRPIPEQYSTITKTPLKIDVTADQKTYTIKLTRKS